MIDIPFLNSVQLAAKLRSGSAAIFPTDTLPALAAKPEYAFQIWNLKKRSIEKPLILMGANADELFEYIQANVKKGIDNRIKNANAVEAPVQPGATKENIDDIHSTSAADVIREDLYQKPITLMKPDDIVESSMKSMQIVIDNLAKDID